MRRIIAFWLGFTDGWRQPDELVLSHNVHHLTSERHDLLDLMESLDHGVNMGQTLRRGHRSEADREGYVPWGLRRRLAAAAVLIGTAVPLGHTVAAETINGLTALSLCTAITCTWIIGTGARLSWRDRA